MMKQPKAITEMKFQQNIYAQMLEVYKDAVSLHTYKDYLESVKEEKRAMGTVNGMQLIRAVLARKIREEYTYDDNRIGELL